MRTLNVHTHIIVQVYAGHGCINACLPSCLLLCICFTDAVRACVWVLLFTKNQETPEVGSSSFPSSLSLLMLMLFRAQISVGHISFPRKAPWSFPGRQEMPCGPSSFLVPPQPSQKWCPGLVGEGPPFHWDSIVSFKNFLIDRLIFKRTLMFTAKLSRELGEFSYIPCPYLCTASPIIESGTRVAHLLQSMNQHGYIIITQGPHFTLRFTLGVTHSMSFDKRIWRASTIIVSHRVVWYPKNPLCSIQSPFSLIQALASLDLFPVSIVILLLNVI